MKKPRTRKAHLAVLIDPDGREVKASYHRGQLVFRRKYGRSVATFDLARVLDLARGQMVLHL